MYKLTPKLLFRAPNFFCQHRIFFIPFAGAGASISEPYYKILQANNIDLIALQLPGRENRIDEVPFTDMDTAIESIFSEILPFLDVPFSLWGHCSGGIQSYELAKKIKRTLNIEPDYLFISACATPQEPNAILSKSYYSLSDLDLIDEISLLMNESFSESANQSQIVSILLPGIRADFTLYEKYKDTDFCKFNCPIYCIGGDSDRLVSEKTLKKWEAYTSSIYTLSILENAQHYFIKEKITQVSHIITELLA